MDKNNYREQFGRNNLTEKPLEYYLEAFAQAASMEDLQCG